MKYRHEFEAAPPPPRQARPILLPLCILLLVGVTVFAVSQSLTLNKIKTQQGSEARNQIEELQKEVKTLKETNAVVEKERDEARARVGTLKTELTMAGEKTDQLRNAAEASKAEMEETRLELLKSTEELGERVKILNSRFDNPISAEERKQMQDNELAILRKQVGELLKALSRKVESPSAPKS